MRWIAVAVLFFATGLASVAAHAQTESFEQFIATLEQQIGGRIGVYARDITTGRTWQHRARERFPMMSTFKPLACAHMLTLGEQGSINPDIITPILETDLVPYAPVTSVLVGRPGLSLMELCEATLRTSDNVAANLVLRATGGPAALTTYIRRLGDSVTRLDRWEVELNEATPGDPRDTTTPAAMARLMRLLLVENGLGPAAQQQLTQWMQANAVSDTLLRSVLPAGWRIADRSGAGQNGSRAISAIVWPDNNAPVVVVIYITQSTASMDQLNGTIAKIGRHIFRALATKLQ